MHEDFIIKEKIRRLEELSEAPLIQDDKNEIVSNLLNIDLNKVLNAKGIPDYIKKVATELQSKQYFTTGYYLGSLKDSEVKELYQVVSAVETKDTGSVIFSEAEQELMYKDLTLLSMLLCLAAGKDTLTGNEVLEMKNSMQNFILTEYIHRFKKSHVVYRMNYDMFEHSRPIASVFKKGGNGIEGKDGKGDRGDSKASS